VLGQKHNKHIFADIKQTIDNLVSEFNLYFYDNVFQKFTDQIQQIMDDKYQKYLEISKNYHSHIKEMEYIINQGGKFIFFYLMLLEEEGNNDHIKLIVESLKDEQKSELLKIDETFNNLIIEEHESFKNLAFKNNQGIQYLEEKFKLDIFNLVNSILHPKK